MKRFQMRKKTALTLLLGTFRPISGTPCAEETGNGYTTKECSGGISVGEGCSYEHIEVGPFEQYSTHAAWVMPRVPNRPKFA